MRLRTVPAGDKVSTEMSLKKAKEKSFKVICIVRDGDSVCLKSSLGKKNPKDHQIRAKENFLGWRAAREVGGNAWGLFVRPEEAGDFGAEEFDERAR